MGGQYFLIELINFEGVAEVSPAGDGGGKRLQAVGARGLPHINNTIYW